MANSRPGHLLKPTNCTEEELHFDWRRFWSFVTGLGANPRIHLAHAPAALCFQSHSGSAVHELVCSLFLVQQAITQNAPALPS